MGLLQYNFSEMRNDWVEETGDLAANQGVVGSNPASRATTPRGSEQSDPFFYTQHCQVSAHVPTGHRLTCVNSLVNFQDGWIHSEADPKQVRKAAHVSEPKAIGNFMYCACSVAATQRFKREFKP